MYVQFRSLNQGHAYHLYHQFLCFNFEQAFPFWIKSVQNLTNSKYLLIQNMAPKDLLKINIMTLK